MARQVSRAVAEDHAPSEVQEDSPERKRWRSLDWFATPPFASRAGAELILSVDPKAKRIWEPACGDEIMAECFKEYFPASEDGGVFASDIEPQTKGATKLDFLDGEFMPDGLRPDWIATNPPFGHAAAFVRRGLEVAERGVAVLCRLAFLETLDRFTLHHCHLTVLAPFCERVPMQLGPWNPKCSTATAYAWFLYDKNGAGAAGPRVRLIEPGTKARLSKSDDVQRFGPRAEGSLL
jgi:hypothetical protein